MKKLLTSLMLCTVASGAYAADAVFVEPVADVPPVVMEPSRNFYIEGRLGYGPALLDLDAETEAVPGGLGPLGDFPAFTGRIESDYIAGGAVEAGYFLNDYFRVSAEYVLGYIENETEVIDPNIQSAAILAATTQLGAPLNLAGRFSVDGGAVVQQFIGKVGVEYPVLRDFFFIRQLSLQAFVGAGAVHIDTQARITSGPSIGGRIDDSDTVFAGKIGVGTVSQVTDSLSFVNEISYLRGEDGDFTQSSPRGIRIPLTLETQALTLQSGLRYRF